MWPNPQFPADLVTYTEEILNGKLHFWAVTGGLVFFKISQNSQQNVFARVSFLIKSNFSLPL